jgi:hypothetical protein
MSDEGREIYDEDREEVLRLILAEAGGADVRRELESYPLDMRSTFRRVVQEAGLVEATHMDKSDDGEMLFGKGTSLTPRGRKRLAELNGRRSSSNGSAV